MNVFIFILIWIVLRIILHILTNKDKKFGSKFYSYLYITILVDILFFFYLFFHWIKVKPIFSYFFAINIVTFLYYGLDKLFSEGETFRFPEKILLGLSFVGGSVGAFFGMYIFHHKTRKTRFQIWFWILVIIQVILIYVLYRYILR